jgi:hypothetical protein
VTQEAHDTLAQAIFRRSLKATWDVADRLAYSRGSVSGLFPISPDRLDEVTDADEERLDALLFRFSSAFSMVQDHLFKSIAIVEGEDISSSSRRDVANLMEKLGAIPSSGDITALSALRNKVSHVYPDHPEKQAEILNGIHQNAETLLGVMRDLSAYVVRKGLLADPPRFEVRLGGVNVADPSQEPDDPGAPQPETG